MELIRIIIMVLVMYCSRNNCLASPAAFLPEQAPEMTAPTTATPEIEQVVDLIIPQNPKALITDGVTMGNPEAQVVVYAFADFQCPACGYYWSMLEPTIVTDYVNTGKVYFIFIPFSFLGQYGTDPIWDESVKAAEAAYCANDQGNFWEYHDYLFANQNGENAGAFSRNRLIVFADSIGLDNNAFVECLDSGINNQYVNDATGYAMDVGSTYTPSFLVGSTIVSADELIQTIEDALSLGN